MKQYMFLHIVINFRYNFLMKHYELKKVTELLSGFRKIVIAKRVEDNIIKFVFDKNECVYVDLKRGNSTWFMCENYLARKSYSAPFDVILAKHFARSSIVNVEVEQNNRIMRIEVQSGSQYKSVKTTLQLEFTGRNTNAIILDENGVVLEALRHIDSRVSFREISVGKTLLPLPERELKETPQEIEDIKSYLFDIYEKRQTQFLLLAKESKLSIINKKLKRLEKQMNSLALESELDEKSKKLNSDATLVLANIGKIKPYEKEVTLEDFDGQMRTVALPKDSHNAQNASNILFANSKKLRQKAKYVHIERENLQEKIDFLKKLTSLIQNAKSIDEVQVLFPKQQKKAKKIKEEPYESFFYEDFKILVGKSEKSNIALMKSAKKSDIWLHVKDIPSSHVIIKTNKQTLPENVLEFAAKLCVNFSSFKQGSFLVDYTKWQYVKIESGANVFYTDYKTIKIDKG